MVVNLFSKEYLRKQNDADINWLFPFSNLRVCHVMLEWINCIHWEWKNFPFSWHEKYKGHVAECTIIFEALASIDLKTWHSFLGMAGFLNDINMLQQFLVFWRFMKGNAR
jgi:hypothetical protein